MVAARHSVRIGLVGAIVLFSGIALLFAFEQPPFARSGRDGPRRLRPRDRRLRPPRDHRVPRRPGQRRAVAGRARVDRDDRYRAVWVANHPPLHYLATAPLIWLSNAPSIVPTAG